MCTELMKQTVNSVICALQIMGSDRVRQTLDNITLFNTLLEKEMKKDI